MYGIDLSGRACRKPAGRSADLREHCEQFSLANAEQSAEDVSTTGVWIRGVGYCHALRIYLKPKFGSRADEIESEANDLKGEASPFVNQENEFDLPPVEQIDNLDTKAGSTQLPVTLVDGRAPANPNIAIDSFCIMNGSLQLHQRETTVSSSYDIDAPTNVYVNGYQSWSFCGSVLRGEPQPKSAMPNFLRAAFNRDSKANMNRDCWNDGVHVNSSDLSDHEDDSDDELTEWQTIQVGHVRMHKFKRTR
ncbi:hypothetical protein THAOC_35671 [Thalassiosira oceanica]|uniref:Uncharacterized protein n=1 Tax=Thalassiosira oceanica TaxID=159749 RepID=K0RGQ8_THAOC|nr:hypothetical protein THAOC_35671 [Thalassiosira oceanica]|eukprot:EJK45702.1 hypothetical protein THAOC_35671 [Thalassiosira oceanica]